MLGRFASFILICIARAARSRVTAFAALMFAGIAVAAGPALSASGSAAIVVDARTGKVLYSSNADTKRYPASLTKMMTLYLLFEAIDRGDVSMNSRITMSKFAASQPPSKLGLKAGKTILVEDAILALITRSANDVATAIGEHLAGSESAFARRMTERARQLGMSGTTFRNAHGLPNTSQVTTARDMATLGRALQQHFPEYFKLFATRSFTYGGARIANHNRLLGNVEGVNGIKTGYTRASGYNLVTSVDRNGRRIVAVVMGGSSGRARDQKMAGLIEDYISRASRSADVAAIPRPGAAGGSRASAALVAMTTAPMPRLRPTVQELPNEPAVVAALAPEAVPAPLPIPVLASVAAAAAQPQETGAATVAAIEPAPVAAPAPAPAVDGAPDALALAPPDNDGPFAANSIATLIGANSIFALDAVAEQEGDASFDDDEAEVAAAPATTGAAPLVDLSGWKIQLAATPNEESAKALLEQAREKAAAVLADAAPYTEPVEAGSGTLFRARFAGFADKEEARAACVYLAKKNFNCLAIAN